MMNFNPDFIKSLDGLPGVNPALLLAALDSPAPVSVRFNPFKVSQQPEGRRIPWSKYGYYLDERPQFTLDPLFHAGAYYVQEASSMFLEHIYRETVGDAQGLRVLDLCAAPGGKTTLLSTLVGLDSTVVANEVMRPRALTLADNVRKWGLGNVAVTNNDPAHFAGFRDYFDVILVDAPCSGEGMFRKNPDSRAEWSLENVKLCAARQRRILGEIWGALKPGGLLIYSTCTFNRQENEENVAWLAEQYSCEGVTIDIPAEWGIVAGEVESREGAPIGTFRFYPDKVEGEGFFAAVMCKESGKARTNVPKPRKTLFSELPRQAAKEAGRWVNQQEFMHFAHIGDTIYGYYNAAYSTVKLLSETLSVMYSGVQAGQIFSGKLKPEHPLALFHDLSREAVNEAPLTLDDALQYLRKNDIDPSLLDEGLNLITFDGFALGWIKRIGRRSNNLYPKELRIMNL